MRYVIRDEYGNIDAAYAYPVDGADEVEEGTDPDLITFAMGSDTDAALRSFLASTDSELLRIVEDVVNVLIENSLVLLTDFPEAAQQKLMRRKTIRDKLQLF